VALLLLSFSSSITSIKTKIESKSQAKTATQTNTFTQTSTKTKITCESAIRQAAKQFMPYLYVHSGETYFPTSIESLHIKWASDLSDSKATISYNYSAGKKLNNKAPVYTKIQKTKTGGYLFTYAYIYAYNACGPKLNVKAKATFGISLSINKDIKLCPAGVHNGDIEHTQVRVDKELNFISITIAYHAWDKTFKKNEIEWDGTHPLAYMAKGSHALYPHGGNNHYLSLWSIDKTTSGKCPAICKKWGIPYPCLKSCKYGFSSSGSFYDTTGKDSKFTGKMRVIASDAFEIKSSSLSSDEKKLLLYQGRFGEKVENKAWSDFRNTVSDVLSPLYKVCSSCKSEINKLLDEGESEYESNAPASLAKKDWWVNSGI